MSAPDASISATRAIGWTRRGYAALAVGLAVFLALMVVLREPVRGYLATVRLAGPLPAGEEPDGLAAWLESSAVGVRAKVSSSELYPGDCQIVLEHVGPRPHVAEARLKDLAQQFVSDYLPSQQTTGRQTRLARLQAELQAARDQEDLLRVQLDALRQRHLVALSQNAQPQPELVDAHGASADASDAASSGPSDERSRRLDSLRQELARLLAGFTDEHPQVIAVRSQIARLEEEISHESAVPTAREVSIPPQSAGALLVSTTADRLSTRTDGGEATGEQRYVQADDLSGEMEAAQAALAAATRNREWSEGQLQMALDALANAYQPTTWSVAPVEIVARIGGTPHTSTLLAALLVAAIAAVLMYQAASVLTRGPWLRTAAEVEAFLGLPLVGQLPSAKCLGLYWKLAPLGPLAVKAAVHAAELWTVVVLLVCALAMAGDPALAPEFASDPLGTLSDVAGRVLPNG